MLAAVHTDRSGRVYVSADYRAAGFDGASTIPLDAGIPLPPTATLIPLPREAQGLDRTRRVRPLGRTRWALAATLPPGYTRTLHPAFRPTDEHVAAHAYAALGADDRGQLVAAAVISDPAAAHAAPVGPPDAAGVADFLRDRTGNVLLRQLARCAREYSCAGAAAVFAAAGEGSVPLAGEGADPVARHGLERAAPVEAAAFLPSAAEIAEVAAAHLGGHGSAISFGRACDGEPLAHARLIEEAVRSVRATTRRGAIHVETDGTRPQALRRVLAAGIDSVAVRLEDGQRAVRRESLEAAAAAGAAIAACVRVFPGRTDRPGELDELIELLSALPGGTLVLRDRPGDPRGVAAGAGALLGIVTALDRLARELPHWRIAAFPRLPVKV